MHILEYTYTYLHNKVHCWQSRVYERSTYTYVSTKITIFNNAKWKREFAKKVMFVGTRLCTTFSMYFFKCIHMYTGTFTAFWTWNLAYICIVQDTSNCKWQAFSNCRILFYLQVQETVTVKACTSASFKGILFRPQTFPLDKTKSSSPWENRHFCLLILDKSEKKSSFVFCFIVPCKIICLIVLYIYESWKL